MKFVLFLTLLVSSQLYASVLQGDCAYGIRHHSFNYGVKSKVTNVYELPPAVLLDRVCFDLGYEYGENVLASQSQASCIKDFNWGLKRAMDGKQRRTRGSALCSFYGYAYGLSSAVVH